MMQPTDTAIQTTSSPEVPALQPQAPEAHLIESAQTFSNSENDRYSPPLSLRSSEMPYAVKLLAITSTVGMGTILLGQGLWQPDTNAARLPTSEAIGVNRPSQPPLRDRVSVTPLKVAAMSPPESLPVVPINATPPNQLTPSTELPTVRISHGFGNAGQPTPAATLPIPTLPVPTIPVPTVPIPTSPVPQAAPPTRVETQVSRAPKQTFKQPAKQPPAVIASLLETPKPQEMVPQLSSTVAIVPQPNAPIEQTAPDRNPSPAVQSPATQTVRKDASKQPAPAAFPVPAAAMQIASVVQLTAIESPHASLEGIHTAPITITGNTRFSSRELLAVVRRAIAANAERSANGQPLEKQTMEKQTMENQVSQAELQQASDAITQFYAMHGYTNVMVDGSTAVFNGAAPKIRIVETTLDTHSHP